MTLTSRSDIEFVDHWSLMTYSECHYNESVASISLHHWENSQVIFQTTWAARSSAAAVSKSSATPLDGYTGMVCGGIYRGGKPGILYSGSLRREARVCHQERLSRSTFPGIPLPHLSNLHNLCNVTAYPSISIVRYPCMPPILLLMSYQYHHPCSSISESPRGTTVAMKSPYKAACWATSICGQHLSPGNHLGARSILQPLFYSVIIFSSGKRWEFCWCNFYSNKVNWQFPNWYPCIMAPPCTLFHPMGNQWY